MSELTEELPRRPRRRLVTPLSAVLAFALVAALGFIGGVQVQKSQGSATAARGGFAGARAGFTGGGFGAGAQPAGDNGATQGTVKNVNGSSLYVTVQGGDTVRVKTTSATKVTRTASSEAKEIHPGDTVVIEGGASSSGTVKATSVTATASNAN
jgi:hypothetical protein